MYMPFTPVLAFKNILARIVVSCAEADAAAILRAVMSHDARDRRLREEEHLARHEAQFDFIVFEHAPFGEPVADELTEIRHHQRLCGVVTESLWNPVQNRRSPTRFQASRLGV